MTLTRPETRSPSNLSEPFRHDIQALRALAVVAVVLYHLWPNRITGGYVGVDIFFVISGYLITAHLLKEIVATGQLKLGQFWARRAKRLLPASLLVLVVTAIAIILMAPPSRTIQFLTEVSASALYFQNWLLAANSVDYLATTSSTPSPVQHYWSLSVEEQFYVIVPVVMIAVVLLSRRLRLPLGSSLTFLLIGITAASFVYSLWLTTNAAPISYFSTFSRMWEFGAGSLVALAPPLRSARSRHAAVALGVFCMVAAMVMYTEDTPFPGAAALLPVAGAAITIWGGRGSALTWVGSNRAVAFVGNASYSIYLWHWPLIILTPSATGAPLDTVDKLMVIGATVVLSWLSYRFVENPVRFSPNLLGGGRRPRTIAVWSALGMAAVLLITLPAIAAAEARASASAETSRTLLDGADCLGAVVVTTGCTVDDELQDELFPSIDEFLDDDANRSECWSTRGDSTLRVCSLGPDGDYDARILAVGDSHNNTLIDTYEIVANTLNWRIDVAGRIGCHWTDARMEFSTAELTAECEDWRDQVDIYVASQTDLDGVLVTNARQTPDGRVVPEDGATFEEASVAGLIRAWESVPDGTILMGLVDNPLVTPETIACVERELLDAAENCTVPRSAALPGRDLEAAIASRPGSHLIDLTDIHCEPQECRPVIGNVIVYSDSGHLTATYARTLAPELGSRLAEALETRQ